MIRLAPVMSLCYAATIATGGRPVGAGGVAREEQCTGRSSWLWGRVYGV